MSLQKKLIEGFVFGVGMVLAFALMFGIAIAFVEPSSGPGTNYLVDSASPIASNFSYINSRINELQTNQTLLKNNITALNLSLNQTYKRAQFVGYTGSTYNGSMGSTKGANSLCNLTYAGSHAMNYQDWVELKYDYPYTYDVWLIDGSYGDSTRQVSKDGYGSGVSNPLFPMCIGWNSYSSSYYGPILKTTGGIIIDSCDQTFRLACTR